jgi:hypothetical protein
MFRVIFLGGQESAGHSFAIAFLELSEFKL